MKIMKYALIMALLATVTAAPLMAADNAAKTGKHANRALRLDTNKDGILSEAEFTAPAIARFKKADANSDGKVTREEIQVVRKVNREKRAARKAARAAKK